jgi:hypothetical protein
MHRTRTLVVTVALASLAACGNPDHDRAIDIVDEHMTGEAAVQLGILSTDLEAMDNPEGEGVLVYHPETRFLGVERFYLWLVLDDRAWALNGATRGLTPDLEFPRDVPRWEERTGLDPLPAEALEIVFGAAALSRIRARAAAVFGTPAELS